jgi:hypothetical protein
MVALCRSGALLGHTHCRYMNSKDGAVPGDTSAAVTEEPGVSRVDKVMTSMAHLGTRAAAALAVYQPTCIAKVPAASMGSDEDLQQAMAMS